MTRSIKKALSLTVLGIVVLGGVALLRMARRPPAPTLARQPAHVQRHVVLETLDDAAFRDAMPRTRELSLQQYMTLKATYIERHGNWSPKYSLTYEAPEGDARRGFWLTPESFDDDSVWVAELTQYRSKSWDWIARYRLSRSPQVDGEFDLEGILARRARVIGGLKYGMTAARVIAIKGSHFKIHHHADFGADLVYDDVIASVRHWAPPRRRGRIFPVMRSAEGHVVHVKAVTDEMKTYFKDFPYEDEKED